MAWFWFVLFGIAVLGWFLAIGAYENCIKAMNKNVAQLQHDLRTREALRAATEGTAQVLQWQLKIEKEKCRVLEMRYREAANAQALDPELLSRAIRLCHPDKHGGSKMATEVTQQLLKMRG